MGRRDHRGWTRGVGGEFDDGSSRFGKDSKWGFFPSAALAWRLSEEELIKNMGIFDNLKLRTSFGISGSEAITPYSSWTLMTADSRGYIINNNSETAYRPQSLGDPTLSWEETSQLDVGLDISVLNSRLNLVLDYYNKVTNDLFVNIPVPRHTGFASKVTNIGKLQNYGLEFAANWKVIDNKLKWMIDANITWQKSKVLDLGLDVNPKTGYEEYITGKTNIFEFVQIVRVWQF